MCINWDRVGCKIGTGWVAKMGQGWRKNKTGGAGVEKLGQGVGVVVKMRQEVGIIAKRYSLRLCFFLEHDSCK